MLLPVNTGMWSKRKWPSKENVSANLQRTAIVPDDVPIQLSTRDCARSAMKKRGRRSKSLWDTTWTEAERLVKALGGSLRRVPFFIRVVAIPT